MIALAVLGTDTAVGDVHLARRNKGKVIKNDFDCVCKAQSNWLTRTEHVPEIDSNFQVAPSIGQALDVVGDFSIDGFVGLEHKLVGLVAARR